MDNVTVTILVAILAVAATFVFTGRAILKDLKRGW